MAKQDEIRVIAYNIWGQEGCPNGKDCEHWLAAEVIWEQRNNKTVAMNAKTNTNNFAPKTNKLMPKRKR